MLINIVLINKYKYDYDVLLLASSAILSFVISYKLFWRLGVVKLQDNNMPSGKTQAQKRLAVHIPAVTSVTLVCVNVDYFVT